MQSTRPQTPTTLNRLFVALIGLALASPCTFGAEPPKSAAPPAVRIEHENDQFITRITVPAREGQIAWADVVRGVAEARGFDPTAIENLLPSGSFDLQSGWTWATLLAANLACDGGIHFGRITDAAHGGGACLEITLNRAALLATQRKFQNMLREAGLRRLPLLGTTQPRTFGIKWTLLPDKADPNKPIVILVHGFNSRRERTGGLLELLPKEKFPVAAFEYPNTQAIADSAQLLSKELKNVAQQFPGREVALVAYSMGGLVARAAVENPDLDPGNVRRLIMVGTPNSGSVLAQFGFALEVWYYVADATRQGIVARLYEALEDGLSEAIDDLTPGSPFLKELNGRKRNPRVAYSLFLGTGGPLTENEVKTMGQKIKQEGASNRFVRFIGPQLDALLADLAEVQIGEGDGAVAVKRGQLAGVADCVLLNCNHLELLGEPANDATGQLRREILQRLTANDKQPTAKSEK